MSRWDELKKLKDAAKSRLDETDFSKLAGDAVLGAQGLAEGAEAVAQRSGLTNKKGEVMKGGSIVTVPGSSIKLLESTQAQEQAKNNAFMSSFMNASQYFAMPEEKARDHAVIALKVPEGVTVEGYGKTVKGGEELVLMVANAGSEAMQDNNPPGYWDTAGWDMK